MKVSEAMTRDVRTVRPDQSIRDAARLMADVRECQVRILTWTSHGRRTSFRIDYLARQPIRASANDGRRQEVSMRPAWN